MTLIGQTVFLECIWSGTAISFVFVCCRFGIRWRVFGRLWYDDAFVFIAWVLILATAILWHTSYPILLLLNRWKMGEQMDASKADLEHVWSMILAVAVLYTLSVEAVKLSFLVFFRRLLLKTDMKKLQIWWWVVCITTLATAVISIGDIPYKCLAGSIDQIQKSCPRILQQDYIVFPAVVINGILDIITDLLIMTIPLAMLWKVQIPIGKKLLLAFIFSLTTVTMAIAIIRISCPRPALNQKRLFVWTSLEPVVAVVVACLASFRQLFTGASREGSNKTCPERIATQETSEVADGRENYIPHVNADDLESNDSVGAHVWYSGTESAESLPSQPLPNRHPQPT